MTVCCAAGYYDAATLLYEYAWAGSFHFSRFYKGESFAASLARLAISHALAPSTSADEAAAAVTRLLGPFVDEVLG